MNRVQDETLTFWELKDLGEEMAGRMLYEKMAIVWRACHRIGKRIISLYKK